MTAAELQRCVHAILRYVDAAGWESHDVTDWWATGWGQQMKQWAYRTEPLGNLIFSAPLLALELWLPWLRRAAGIRKRLYPICLAHHGLACLELYGSSGDPALLQRARSAADRLVAGAIPGTAGLCWGFPHPWSTNVGIVPPHQPAVTQTAYAYDLFERLWQVTGDELYRERLLATAMAVDREYVDLPQAVGLAHTYHGRGRGDIMINAVSYRLHVLAAASAHGGADRRATIEGLAEYVLGQQQEDGSWLYGATAKNRFIDHYHTCFVIKNLVRANRILRWRAIDDAVERGLRYYWRALFDARGLPRPFARSVRLNIIRYESYDFAECLGLFALLGPGCGFSADRLSVVWRGFVDHFVLPNGALRFRVYRVPSVRGYPYYRYGMTAALLALAQLSNNAAVLATPQNAWAGDASEPR